MLKVTHVLLLELFGMLNRLNLISLGNPVQLSALPSSCLIMVMSWNAKGGLALEAFNLLLITVRTQSSVKISFISFYKKKKKKESEKHQKVYSTVIHSQDSLLCRVF